MPEALRGELLALNQAGVNELHRAALAANAISELYADAVTQLVRRAGVAAADVAAIGAHGQTVRHRPREFDGTGYTLQLINGALLAERTGIDVVCDFRSRDVAAGGEGAPLVPAFHAACFAQPGADVAVLNIGGIANLTLLRAGGEVQGFDCGPGNVLMDLWCRRCSGAAYDSGGAWAAGGHVDAVLLSRLLAEPFFERTPPKSTGRDLFDAAWLDTMLAPAATSAQDVMATLAELTARACGGRCAAPRPADAFIAGLRRRRLQRSSDVAPARNCWAPDRRCAAAPTPAFRLNRSKPWLSPGWPGLIWPGSAATCRQSPERRARACWVRSTRPR